MLGEKRNEDGKNISIDIIIYTYQFFLHLQYLSPGMNVTFNSFKAKCRIDEEETLVEIFILS